MYGFKHQLVDLESFHTQCGTEKNMTFSDKYSEIIETCQTSIGRTFFGVLASGKATATRHCTQHDHHGPWKGILLERCGLHPRVNAKADAWLKCRASIPSFWHGREKDVDLRLLILNLEQTCF